MTDEIRGIIERLERAAGPDQELDDAIALLEGYKGSPLPYTYYTASLDAALALVPEGYHWRVGIFKGQFLAGVGEGDLEPKGRMSGYCIGKTAAIALCIAALRARSQPSQPHSPLTGERM